MATGVDVQWLFDEELPARFTGYPDSVCVLEATYQIVLTGYGGGEWFIDVTGAGPPTIRPGEPEVEADCTVVMACADFQRYFANPLMNAMQLYMQGKIKTLGDPALFHKLARLFTLPRVS